MKGFQYRPAFGLPYNEEYYTKLIEYVGFVKQSDSVSGYLSTDIEIPEKFHRVEDLVKKRKRMRIAQNNKRKDIKALAPHLQELYNNALGGTTGNVPITQEEARGIANQMLRFADPKLEKIVIKGDEPIGFLFAYPDVSEAIQRIKGKVFPFGWISIFTAYKNTEWIRINGEGISEKHRGLGGTAILFSEMQKSVRQRNFRHADIVQIGVENDRMHRELEDLGVDFYKTHRVYERNL